LIIEDVDMDCLTLIEERMCRADCCGIIPFSLSFWIQHRKFSQVDVRGLMNVYNGVGIVKTQDGYCAFLIRATRRCAIYLHRPALCRDMGEGRDPLLECPHFNSDGALRTRAERKRFIRENSKRIDLVLRKSKETKGCKE